MYIFFLSLYFSFGKALLTLGEYKSAMTELQKALKIDPENEAIKKMIKLVSYKEMITKINIINV